MKSSGLRLFLNIDFPKPFIKYEKKTLPIEILKPWALNVRMLGKYTLMLNLNTCASYLKPFKIK